MANTIFEIKHGDCVSVLKDIPDNSLDSIVTDPPYGLEFMGKEWDAPWKEGAETVSSRTGQMKAFQAWCETWAVECLRVLKPGGHLLAFGGTRTSHRLTSAIEDAGFEVRDVIVWLYGSGMPKGMNVSKGFDKQAGAEREVVGRYELPDVADGHRKKGWECTNTTDAGMFGVSGQSLITAPATDLAKQWEGWNTQLKPAYEPCILARKPLIGSVLDNVREYETGALHVDACRVGSTKNVPASSSKTPGTIYGSGSGMPSQGTEFSGHNPNVGRWPANVVLDEVAAGMLDEQAGDRPCGSYTGAHKSDKTQNTYGTFKGVRQETKSGVGSTGGASRFFYTAKADNSERTLRDGTPSKHPTVKPVSLMRWLVRLVTPPNGTVLDPFNGSGSTGVAALLEGFNYIGIEREESYVTFSRKRLTETVEQRGLSDDLDTLDVVTVPTDVATPEYMDIDSLLGD